MLCPGKAYDRSPCGTGTSAKLACLAADGEAREGEEWVQESVIGSRFRARYRWLDRARGEIAPVITGEAHVTAEATLRARSGRSLLLGNPMSRQAASGAKRVVVIGGGIVGLCVAHAARTRGHEVMVVERERDGGDSCSFGNAGMITPSHFIPLAEPSKIRKALTSFLDSRSPFYLQPRLERELVRWGLLFLRSSLPKRAAAGAPILRDLLLASRALHVELAAELGNAQQLAQRGMLLLCRTQAGLDEEAHIAERARALGMPAELCSPARAAELDPGARMSIQGAVHYPLDCHLLPMRLVSALVESLRSRSVELRWRCEATGWRVASGRVQALVTDARARLLATSSCWPPAAGRPACYGRSGCACRSSRAKATASPTRARGSCRSCRRSCARRAWP